MKDGAEIKDIIVVLPEIECESDELVPAEEYLQPTPIDPVDVPTNPIDISGTAEDQLPIAVSALQHTAIDANPIIVKKKRKEGFFKWAIRNS